MREAGVVVIGGGAMGSAAAWSLARRGVDVVLLEQFAPLHTKGSSHGGSRIFRLAYPDELFVRMAQDALPLWRELEEDAKTTLLETTGGIDHGADHAVHQVAGALAACGARAEWLSPGEAETRYPGLRFDGEVLYQPDAGRCLADDTVNALHVSAAGHGAELRFSEPVEEIECDGDDVVVITAFDEYVAPVLIVAGGAWAPKLLDRTVSLPPMKITQEQTFHFLAHDETMAWPSFVHHRTPVIYGLETPDEGIKVAEHHTGAPVDPDDRDFAIDPGGEERVSQYVAEWVPGVEGWASTATTCLYTTTATEDFVVERHGNIVVAAGFSGHGFKFTPLIGRTLADLAAPPT